MLNKYMRHIDEHDTNIDYHFAADKKNKNGHLLHFFFFF